jgi:thiol-disulfide isomerase/thioredoxin
MIFFWHTECSPCINEIPGINYFSNKYKDKVSFLSFSADKENKLKEFLSSTPLNAINCSITRRTLKASFALFADSP